MAFPTVKYHVGDDWTTDTVTQSMYLTTNGLDGGPAMSISANDVIIVLACRDAGGTATFSGAGLSWTELDDGEADPVGRMNAQCYVARAAGGEGGSVLSHAGNGQSGAWQVYVLSGTHGDANINNVVSLGVFDGPEIQPNPPLHDPPNWGAEDCLWIAATGWDNGSRSVTAYPTNYTNGLQNVHAIASGAGIGSARRELNAASEDPVAFTLSATNEDFRAYTIAIRPAATLATGPPLRGLRPGVRNLIRR